MQPRNNNEASYNIIPTPQQVKKAGIGFKSFYPSREYSILILGNNSERLEFCARFLSENLKENFSLNMVVYYNNVDIKERASIIICNDEALLGENILENQDYEVFKNKNAEEQGYIIKCREDFPITIYAMNDLGCLYGASTLLQLFRISYAENSPLLDKIIIDYITVYDFPDFRYRGNDWLIWSEAGVWSYDRGDGIDAYKNRIIRKLDMMLKYKLNFVLNDSFGWEVEKFPGYSELMKKLNQEARLRGIHIISGGYGMGYGMSGSGENVYKGKVFENRKSYPDGEIYSCIGTFYRNKKLAFGSEFGTCISNEELMKQKMQEIKNFVSEIEPGALYIHNLDVDNILDLTWKERCSDCRKLWPDDDLFSKDGAAGAFAYFFDTMIDEIGSIKNVNYDAGKDCIILLVSPGYMTANGTDDYEWELGLKFWTSVSKYMKKKDNIFILFRELFFNHTDNTIRVKELNRRIQKEGSGHQTGIIYFSGGDGYYSDKTFQITSIFNYMFEGSDMVICANGNAFQEPLQLFNAEYMWNMNNSSFYNIQNKPENNEEFITIYKKCMKTEFRPEEIYGENGFLEFACKYLYGEGAAKDVSEMFKLHGVNYEPFVAYAANVEMETGHHRTVYPMRWDNILDQEQIDKMVEKFDELHKITRNAKELMENALVKTDPKQAYFDDMKWYTECLNISSKYTEYLSNYMKIYKKLDKRIILEDTDEDTDTDNLYDINVEIDEIITNVKGLKRYLASLGLKAIDHLGGALVRREEILDFIQYNLELMIDSIQIKNRMPENRKKLPERKWW